MVKFHLRKCRQISQETSQENNTDISSQSDHEPNFLTNRVQANNCQRQEKTYHDNKIKDIFTTNQTGYKLTASTRHRQPISHVTNKIVILPPSSNHAQYHQHGKRTDSCHDLVRSQTGHENTDSRVSTDQQV